MERIFWRAQGEVWRGGQQREGGRQAQKLVMWRRGCRKKEASLLRLLGRDRGCESW